MNSKNIITTATIAVALSMSVLSAFAAEGTASSTNKHPVMHQTHKPVHVVASTTKKIMHEEDASSTKRIILKKSTKKVVPPKTTHKPMIGHMPVASGTRVMPN